MSEECINSTGNGGKKVVINVALPADVLADLDAVIEITGRTASDIISKELREYFVHFQNDEGNITPRPAILLHGVTEYERTVAEVEGREIQVTESHCLVLAECQVTESPCIVLAECSVMGSPYYKIWDTKQGHLAKVPALCIHFPDSPAKGE